MGSSERPPCVSPCSECGPPIRFDLWAFVDQASSGTSLSDDEVRALGLTRRRVGDLQITAVSPEGPAAYVRSLSCPRCAGSSRVVVGLGEVQSCRWMGGVVE